MTTSLSPTTTNCEPVFNFSRLRIDSGMTTWPLDDIFVVAKSAIYAPPKVIVIVKYNHRKPGE
jgi:hypothetical protein